MNRAHPPERSALSPRPSLGSGEEAHLTAQQGEAVVRLVETAPVVSRRHQFFIWSQGPLHALLPHQVLVCGAYARQDRSLAFSAFQSVVLSPEVLAPLADASSPLLRACASGWVQCGGRPLVLDCARLMGDAQQQGQQLLHQLGPMQLVVHGVARPQRASEVESLFVFLCTGNERTHGERALHAELVMPYLHATWRRVLTAEAELGAPLTLGAPGAESGPTAEGASPTQSLTDREREILMGAREGKSNQEIGLSLGISALTVKNHIQKILRKLGAHNRAHAVALAMTQDLFVSRRERT